MSLWSKAKELAKASNPIGLADTVYTKATGNKSLIPNFKVNGVEVAPTMTPGFDIAQGVMAYDQGQKQIKEQKKVDTQVNQDQANFDAFKNQNQEDLLNSGDDLYTPAYQRRTDLADAQAGMVSLFNARKDQIMAGRRQPGIAQTRF